MGVDIVADVEVDIVVSIEVDKVSCMVADIEVDMGTNDVSTITKEANTHHYYQGGYYHHQAFLS